MLTARAMDVLPDGEGIRCLACGGQGSPGGEGGEGENCPECEGEGKYCPTEGDFRRIDESEQAETYLDTLRLVFGMRERPPLPTEWLDQPAEFAAAYRFLIPFIVGEFDERQEALRKSDEGQ